MDKDLDQPPEEAVVGADLAAWVIEPQLQLPRERLHHYGFGTNHLSMLAWQAHRNAQTEAIFPTRHAPTAADPPLPRAS